MNNTIIVENNSGAFAMIGKVLGNRAVLGLLVIVLAGWRLHDWWWREDVCAARYERADQVFKKQTARKNAKVSKTIKKDLVRDGDNRAARAAQNRQADEKLDWYKGKTDAVIPRDIHGAIQKVR